MNIFHVTNIIKSIIFRDLTIIHLKSFLNNSSIILLFLYYYNVLIKYLKFYNSFFF